MEDKSVKAVYETPAIEEHGDVKSITLAGHSVNGDTPRGTSNAYGPS